MTDAAAQVPAVCIHGNATPEEIAALLVALSASVPTPAEPSHARWRQRRRAALRVGRGGSHPVRGRPNR